MRVLLGPGFAPGLAGIGVLLELEERQVSVDEVIGVNTGALVAALWATRQDLAKATEVLAHLPWDKYFVATSLGEADPLLQTIQLLTQRTTFDKAPRKMGVLSRGLKRLECQMIQEGSIAHAVRGSMSVPGIFHPIGTKAETDFMDAGARWWHFIEAEVGGQDRGTLWVVPDILPITADMNQMSEKDLLAAYIGLTWDFFDLPSASHLIRVSGVGDILSFDKALEWMMAGREATKNWLTGEKGLCG